MPTQIYFVGGGRLTVDEEPEEAKRLLEGTFAGLHKRNGGLVYVRSENVTFFEDYGAAGTATFS